jgi:hypothetical protein
MLRFSQRNFSKITRALPMKDLPLKQADPELYSLIELGATLQAREPKDGGPHQPGQQGHGQEQLH